MGGCGFLIQFRNEFVACKVEFISKYLGYSHSIPINLGWEEPRRAGCSIQRTEIPTGGLGSIGFIFRSQYSLLPSSFRSWKLIYWCLSSIFPFPFRFIVFRRVFFILGWLYLMRSFTMYVTVLPVASRSYALNVCAPKANTTSPFLIARRALQLMSGFGLSMNGQHVYCGDYMYSGHTVVLVSAYLIITECK